MAVIEVVGVGVVGIEILNLALVSTHLRCWELAGGCMNVAIGRSRSHDSVGINCDARRCCRIVLAHSLTAGAFKRVSFPG